jgi:hypothetical protein
MKLRYVKILILTAGFNMLACDSFLNINEDPNNPTSARLNQLLPSTQVDIAGALGFSTGGLSQITSSYMHQTVQRGFNINDYGITGDDFGVITPWNLLYTFALQDMEIIIKDGTTSGALHYVGVAQITKAYLYSIMVDVWGDVPFSEANKAPAVTNPKYDLGQDIYPQLFDLLDAGMANLEASSTLSPGPDDLFYGGDLDLWRKFAKTVKLKMYNQIRLVENVTAEVDALLADDDMINNAAEDFQFDYNSGISPDNRNPAYVVEWGPGTAGYYISPYFYETMANLNTFNHRDYGNDIGVRDPRIPYYFYNQIAEIDAGNTPENACTYCYGYDDGNGNFIVSVPELAGTGMLSIHAFSFNIDPFEGFDQGSSQTLCGLYPLGGKFDDGNGGAANLNGNPGIPQRILTHYAKKYIEAELYLTGAASGGQAAARAAFNDALVASFAKVNQLASSVGAPVISNANRNTYINAVLAAYDAASTAGKLEHIITQKWIASFGWGVDSYTDFRRTGFPVLYDGDADNIVVTDRTRDFPFSFPWTSPNLQVNSSAPAQKIVTSPDAKPFWMN